MPGQALLQRLGLPLALLLRQQPAVVRKRWALDAAVTGAKVAT
jgi:hypothetical protein